MTPTPERGEARRAPSGADVFRSASRAVRVSKGTVYNVVHGLHWTTCRALPDEDAVRSEGPADEGAVAPPVESGLERELRESREAARL
jgi:hypothetical protein